MNHLDEACRELMAALIGPRLRISVVVFYDGTVVIDSRDDRWECSVAPSSAHPLPSEALEKMQEKT